MHSAVFLWVCFLSVSSVLYIIFIERIFFFFLHNNFPLLQWKSATLLLLLRCFFFLSEEFTEFRRGWCFSSIQVLIWLFVFVGESSFKLGTFQL